MQKLEELERQGQDVLSRYNASLTELDKVQKNRGLARSALNLPILKPTHRRAGKLLLNFTEEPHRKANISEDFVNQTDTWLNSIINNLKEISQVTGSLSNRGNSPTIVRMFNQARNGVKPDTKLRRGLGVIGRLKTYNLIFNRDIPGYLNEKKASDVVDRHSWAKNVNKLLKDYPTERIALLGAIESFEAKGIDANRQCLSSCRNCIESLVKRLSSNYKWSDGLTLIVRIGQKRKIIKDTYAFLSNHGTHGTQIPTDADTRAGIDQTLAAVRLILSDTK